MDSHVDEGVVFPMSLSKSKRFEIFKRDGFRCQYCGLDSSSPDTVLEVDHIVPSSKGGTHEDDNLITSCFSCNRGKSNKDLSLTLFGTEQKLEREKERLHQYQEYLAYIGGINDIVSKQIDAVEKIFERKFLFIGFNDRFRTVSMRTFLKRLHFNLIIEAMELACLKDLDHEATLKYFCAICWNKIKDKDKTPF